MSVCSLPLVSADTSSGHANIIYVMVVNEINMWKFIVITRKNKHKLRTERCETMKTQSLSL